MCIRDRSLVQDQLEKNKLVIAELEKSQLLLKQGNDLLKQSLISQTNNLNDIKTVALKTPSLIDSSGYLIIATVVIAAGVLAFFYFNSPSNSTLAAISTESAFKANEATTIVQVDQTLNAVSAGNEYIIKHIDEALTTNVEYTIKSLEQIMREKINEHNYLFEQRITNKVIDQMRLLLDDEFHPKIQNCFDIILQIIGNNCESLRDNIPDNIPDNISLISSNASAAFMESSTTCAGNIASNAGAYTEAIATISTMI
jgi:hypothetical protein